MITPRTALVVLLVTTLYTSQSTSAVAQTGNTLLFHGSVVTQIGDGQISAPTSAITEAPVTQIGDGQISAPTSAITEAPVPQIIDGQISAPTSAITEAPVTQITDGQISPPTSAITEAPPLLITPAPTAGCTGCYIAMGTSSGTDQSVADIVLTAYSITSAYLSNGVCITTSGVPIVLPKAYTVTSPTIVPWTDFPLHAASEFVDFLGFSTCVGSGEELFPTPIIPVTNISVTPAASASLRVGANSTTSPTLHSSNATKPIVTHRLDERAKIVLDVAAFFALLILILLVAFIWHKRRLRSATITAEKQGNAEDRQEGTSASRGESQPYLQQKAELEAEERRRHELEARQKIHELDPGTEIIEIPAGTHEHRLAVMRSRKELRGEEHSQELDT